VTPRPPAAKRTWLADGRQPLTDQQRRDLGCRPGFRTLDSDTYRERKAWARDAYVRDQPRFHARLISRA
jgi:hypothetical protein